MLREITLQADADVAEKLADALLALGALSVALEDAEADSQDELPLYGEPGLQPEHPVWRHNRLLVMLPSGADPGQTVVAAAEALGIAPPAIAGQRQVDDVDWVRLTQAQFPPTRIGDGLWIVPSWAEPPQSDAVNIRLDPGVAFGTGTHATTRLCLNWLLQNRPRGRVLDYGCGSGVLAIAAARLGASDVIGTDIDDLALEAARANSERNAVPARYTAPDKVPAGTFDVVLANILANPLRLLAPMLLARVARGGALVLSGILQRQADELIKTYIDVDAALPLSVWAADEGWVCLAGRRGG